MFKVFANALHRTPWWALALIGVFSFLALVMFTIPFQVIRLEKAGATAAENQAIKREVDAAFASQGLDVAESFVRAFKSRSGDPVRQAELENALEEIQRAREEIAEAGRVSAEARREAERAVKEAGNEAQRSLRDAAREARRVARDNLIVAAEATLESAQTALDGQRQALRALRDAGVKDVQAEAQLNESIRKAEDAVAKARKQLEAAKQGAGSRGLRITLGADKPAFEIDLSDKDSTGASTGTTAGAPLPPAPPKAPQAPVAGKTPPAPVAPVAPAGRSAPAAPAAPATLPAPPAPPAPPALPRDFRADIHEKVADDFFRLTFGAILILIFIPLFIIAVIAKFFIDRARAAQRVAEEKKQEADLHSMNRQVVEARLMALQAQVEPHFLYNTLANVQALCEADPPLASKMVEHLIQYLRAALPKMRETSSTVGQEMDLVRAYLNILKIRMGARLEFSIDLPEEVAKLPFPPLMLPSLIENAIKHGLEPQRGGGRIDISARREDGLVIIEVKDTGRGFGASTAGGGVGLSNIRERLAGLYGDRGTLILTENEPQGVVATLRVPDTPPREIGAGSFTPRAAASQAPGAPTTLAGRVWGGVKTAHNVWARIAGYSFLILMSLIGIGLVVTLIGTLTGLMPLEFGNARIGGVHGVAVGTLITLVVFTVLAIVAVVVVALLYGLGVMAAFLLVLIPLIILVASFPALAPFIVIGGIIWWVLRARKKEPELPTLKR